jgi:hypothetical protein
MVPQKKQILNYLPLKGRIQIRKYQKVFAAQEELEIIKTGVTSEKQNFCL